MSNNPKSGIRTVYEAIGKAPVGPSDPGAAVALLDSHREGVLACQRTDELPKVLGVRDRARAALQEVGSAHPDSVLVKAQAEQLEAALTQLDQLIVAMERSAALGKPPAKLPELPKTAMPGSMPKPQPGVGSGPVTPTAPVLAKPKPNIPKLDRPQSQQVSEFAKEVKPLDWSEKDARMNTKRLHADLADSATALLDGVPYAPPKDLVFEIGNPLAIGTRYAPSMMDEGARKAFNPLTLEELNDPAMQAKIDGLGVLEQGLSELMTLAKPSEDPLTKKRIPAPPAKEFWEAAEELWKREVGGDKPSGHPQFSQSFAAKPRPDDFEKAYKAQKVAPAKQELGIDAKLEKRIQETQQTLGTSPVAVCLGDDDRTILFNEANFTTEGGEPDYIKADAVLIHESHHAMSKGFVNSEIFGEDEHDVNWAFDEIITEHFTKKQWDKKYPGKEADYFKYTSYFKGQKQDPTGAGWYGHAAADVIAACGGEKVVAKAYFAAHGESLARILAAKAAVMQVIRSAT